MSFAIRMLLGGLWAAVIWCRPAAAQDAWVFDAEQQAVLESGEVLVESEVQQGAASGFVRAAVRVRAAPDTVYRAMTDCAAALQYVPHLEVCVVLERSPDGRSELIEHVADMSWYLPATRYVFEARYEPPRSIAFDAKRGDFRELSGRWELRPDDAGGATTVTYRVQMQPKFRVPQWLVRRSLQRELPELLVALRRFVEAQPP